MSWKASLQVPCGFSDTEDASRFIELQVKEAFRSQLEANLTCAPEMYEAMNVCAGVFLALLESDVLEDTSNGYTLRMSGSSTIKGSSEITVSISSTLNAGGVEASSAKLLPGLSANDVESIPRGFVVGASSGSIQRDFIKEGA